MKLCFPSQQFDAAVTAVCQGAIPDEQARALDELLRSQPAARDGYILRIELHSRLASDPDIFAVTTPEVAPSGDNHVLSRKIDPFRSSEAGRWQVLGWGDRGAGRIFDHFTQRSILPHEQADCVAKLRPREPRCLAWVGDSTGSGRDWRDKATETAVGLLQQSRPHPHRPGC